VIAFWLHFEFFGCILFISEALLGMFHCSLVRIFVRWSLFCARYIPVMNPDRWRSRQVTWQRH